MGWVGAGFLLVGRYFLGRNINSLGLFLSFIGDTLWMLVGFQTNSPALIFTGGSMALLDLQGVFNQRNINRYWKSMKIPKYTRSDYKSYTMK